MKKELVEFLNGARNAVGDEFIISREKSGRSEHVYISHSDIPEPLYQFWTSRDKKRGCNGRPKHTGGKKPYVMLMIEKLTELIATGVPAESIGHLICLSPYIEWGTGRLLVGRQKRQMTVADIEKIFTKKRRATLYILADLKNHGLLEARSLIKRGAGNED